MVDIELDRECVERLSVDILNVALAHLQGAPSHVKVLEVLNALAYAVATLITGCGEDPVARRFFDQATASAIRRHRVGLLRDPAVLHALIADAVGEPRQRVGLPPLPRKGGSRERGH
jgi:hypothetical protein